jgi:predicted small secreted protein
MGPASGLEKNKPPATKQNMNTLTKRIVLLLFVTTLLAVVTVGCNTAHGFGKDMEKAGDKIQDGTK